MKTLSEAERGGAMRRRAAAAAVAALAIGLAGCEDSDPVAPADSTITVSANPQTIILEVGVPPTTELTATVRSKNGTRLPDEEVTFSALQGTLDPKADTTILTDDLGQAMSILTTDTTTTVTARSGGITGTTQVAVTRCRLAQFILNVSFSPPDPPLDQELDDCDDILTFTAEVLQTSLEPCEGELVIFEQDMANDLSGIFTPTQDQSNVDGLVVATWKPNTGECVMMCTDSGDPNGPGDCGDLLFTAAGTNGANRSVPVTVRDNIQ